MRQDRWPEWGEILLLLLVLAVASTLGHYMSGADVREGRIPTPPESLYTPHER